MPKKLKFKSVITRVKLNPEQAVLACDCYNVRLRLNETVYTTSTVGISRFVCSGKTLVYVSETGGCSGVSQDNVTTDYLGSTSTAS